MTGAFDVSERRAGKSTFHTECFPDIATMKQEVEAEMAARERDGYRRVPWIPPDLRPKRKDGTVGDAQPWRIFEEKSTGAKWRVRETETSIDTSWGAADDLTTISQLELRDPKERAAKLQELVALAAKNGYREI